MSHAITKRLACERCRDQKLRCDRGELADGELSKACARCLRAGASCVSSNPRPLGRPSASASNASSDRPFSQSSRRSTASATHSVAARRIRRSNNVGRGAGNGEATISPGSGSIFTWDLRDPTLNGFPEQSDTPDGNDGASSCVPRSPPTNRRTLSGPDNDQPWPPSNFDALSFLGLPLGDDDALLGSLSGAQPVPEISQQLHLESEQGWPGMGESAGPMNAPTDAAGSGPRNGPGISGGTVNSQDTNRSNQTPQIKPPENPLLGLSRLSESITRQIADVDSYPWGPAGVSICAENAHGTMENNPVAKALQSTSDFTSIVQQMQGSPPSSSRFPPAGAFAPSDSAVSVSGAADGQNSFVWSDPPSPANPPAALDAPVALLVLSNYLLLLQLYDRLIHRVLEALRKLLNLSDFFRTGPDVCLGGLPPMKGHLYIKIIVQIIGDHLDRLEQLLGLPARFRLSRRQGASVGILSGVESSGLLPLVMAQLPMGPEGAGTELVVSLRNKMRSLQEILQGPGY